MNTSCLVLVVLVMFAAVILLCNGKRMYRKLQDYCEQLIDKFNPDK